MHHTVRVAVAAALCTLVPAVAIAKAKPTGFDPARAQALSAVPVRVVVLHDRLRSQWAYGSYNMSSDFATQALMNNTVNNMISSGMPAGAAIGAGALGGAIAGAIIDANMRQQARSQVERADALFEAQQCKLALGDSFATAIDHAVAGSAWGAATTPRHDVLAEGKKLADVLGDTPERQQFTVTYSMTPDYSQLVTTIGISTYVASLKAENARRDDPAWTDEIVIASDPLPLADKTPEDIAASLAAEDKRHADTGVGLLIKAANAGDDDARRKAIELTDAHRKNVREAKQKQWSPGEAALRRAMAWSADGCAPLRAAADQQAREAEALLGRLFRGELPQRANEFDRHAATVLSGTERTVEARAIGQYVMGRGGTSSLLPYRYAWYPSSAK